jgi:hypothetical protein
MFHFSKIKCGTGKLEATNFKLQKRRMNSSAARRRCRNGCSSPTVRGIMKRLGRLLFVGVISLAVLLAIAITFTIGWTPFFGPKTRALTNRTFERTPQRLARGRYIATGLSGCVYCHTLHDWTAPGTPMIAGMEGSGETLPYAGLPGRIVAPNLTQDPETGAGALDR